VLDSRARLEPGRDIVLDAKARHFQPQRRNSRRCRKPVRVAAATDRAAACSATPRDRGFTTKTGIMLGSVRAAEIARRCATSRANRTTSSTLGQYCKPAASILRSNAGSPEEFRAVKSCPRRRPRGRRRSGPLVRRATSDGAVIEKDLPAPEHLNRRRTWGHVRR